MRTAADPAGAVVAASLMQLRPGDRPLVVDDPAPDLIEALSARGSTPHLWLRRAGGSGMASVWPAPGPFTSAFVRLAKAKEALDLALHAAAATLPAGAQIVLYGANDEGIRSAASHLEVLADDVVTVDTRRHCRVLMGLRRAWIVDHKPALSDWRRESEIVLAGETRPWVSYPGLFARGGLDEGTALLLAHLPELAADARVLDFGCGTGIIAATLRRRLPGAQIDVLDADALALEAARENVPGARFVLGDALPGAGNARYGAILSNPPIHDGVAEHHGALERLIAEAPRHLLPGGVLQIVVQRRIKAGERMQSAFGNVTVVIETGRYRVLMSRRLR